MEQDLQAAEAYLLTRDVDRAVRKVHADTRTAALLKAELSLFDHKSATGGAPQDMSEFSDGAIRVALAQLAASQAKDKEQVRMALQAELDRRVPARRAPGLEVQKGDVEGHEFHGNQYGDGSAAGKQSSAANAATRAAEKSGSKASWSAARDAHLKAKEAHDKAHKAAERDAQKRGANREQLTAIAENHLMSSEYHGGKASAADAAHAKAKK